MKWQTVKNAVDLLFGAAFSVLLALAFIPSDYVLTRTTAALYGFGIWWHVMERWVWPKANGTTE